MSKQKLMEILPKSMKVDNDALIEKFMIDESLTPKIGPPRLLALLVFRAKIQD